MSLQHRDPYHYIDDFSDPIVRQLIRSPISDFSDFDTSDAQWSAFFQQLSSDFPAYRSCDSDSNSLLRAFGFAYVELLTREIDPPNELLAVFVGEMMAGENVFKAREEFKQNTGILSSVLEHLAEICEKSRGMAMFHTQTLLGKRWFDRLMRDFLRMVLLNYIDLHAEDAQDDWDFINLQPEECRALLLLDSAELDEKFLYLLSKALDVTILLVDFSSEYEDVVKYQGQNKDVSIALYKADNKFGVLYSGDDLEKDHFDLATRRYDVGIGWGSEED